MTTSAATLAALYTSRFCYGARTGDTSGPTPSTYKAWLSQQLAVATDPADVVTRLNAAILTTHYNDINNVAQTDTGPLATLSMSDTQLWTSFQADVQDTGRPLNEVRCAYFIRTMWSSAQLWETMTDFWHNHFSICATSDRPVSAMWPSYDKILRTNAMGNFGAMLNATAKSVSMLHYLNLNSSTATNPNENYAREVMELHTLGIAAYLGETTPPGQASQGYSDADVTQAARVLTGWTDKNGSFVFNAKNHDTGTKTLLGMTIGNSGVTEGEMLLHVLATHPATALHIVQKLYVKFVSDTIPANSTLVPQLVSLFLATTDSTTQIAQMIAAIAASDEFAASTGAKMKTPTELVPSWLRAIGSEFDPNQQGALNVMLGSMGAKLYGWETPNGMPDIASGWLSTSGMLMRWNGPEQICRPASNITTLGGWLAQAPVNNDPQQIPTFVQQLLQSIVPTASINSISGVQSFAQLPAILGSAAQLQNPVTRQAGVSAVVAVALALPEFQIR